MPSQPWDLHPKFVSKVAPMHPNEPAPAYFIAVLPTADKTHANPSSNVLRIAKYF